MSAMRAEDRAGGEVDDMSESPNADDGSDDETDRTPEEGSARTPSRRELLAAAGTAGMGAFAGCSGVTSPTFEATPVVLTTPGQERLNLPEFDLAETTRTRSIAGVGEATITGYLAVHSHPGDGDPPHRFDRPAPTFRRLGALSTPSPEVVGDWVNPFASKPFAELLVGDRGRQLLHNTGIVDTPGFDWRRGPTEVGTADGELLGQPMEAKSYMGVAVGEDSPASTLLMNLARVVTGGNVVIAGEFVRRLTPPDPLDVGGVCADDLCQMPSPAQVDMWRRYKRAANYMATCGEILHQGNTVRVCGGGGGGSTDTEDLPRVGIKDARLVQQVENTDVTVSGNAATYSEPDPDLVEGENTAVAFEFDQLENVDALDGPLEVEIEHGDYGGANRQWESFEIPKSDLEDIDNGQPTTAVLHRLANDGSGDTDNPVFPLSGNPSVVVTTSLTRFDFWERINPSRSVVDLDPLTVGFVRLQDEKGGARYGNGKGRPKNFRRSFRSASAYLRRAYPGDVVTYGHRNHAIVGGTEVTEKTNIFGVTTRAPCDDNCVVFRDMKRGRKQLNRMATDASYPPNGSGFPNGGILQTDGLSQSSVVSKIRNEGFDVVVVIVPRNDSSNSGATGYYNYHNISASGLAYGDPAAAVSALGATASGKDIGISTTVAQEVGHYFQQDYRSPAGHPMAQRRNDSDNNNQPTVNGKPLDPAHARNQNSSRVSGGDPPGVVSTGYDLEGGFDSVRRFENPNGSFSTIGPKKSASSLKRLPSYMSYTPNDRNAWADARIHQQLIDSGWTPPGTSGGGDAAPMLSASGFVAEDGTVRYDDVSAFSGVDRYTDVDGAPVTVELLDPSGEVLQRASVPIEVHGTHHGASNVGGAVEVPSFALPFDEAGVEVRTTYDGAPTVMNPIQRSVLDAVDRVPAEGIEGDHDAAVEAVAGALQEVVDAMDAGDYGAAAEAMDTTVRERIAARVVAYEALLGQPTIETLVPLVDRMVGRLRSLAETTG